MSLDRRQVVAGLGAGAVALAGSSTVFGQAFKGGGRVLAGFPAGGTLDAAARRFADFMKTEFPDGLIVENRPGAGGRLAVDGLKAATPDGLTVLMSPDSMFTIYPSYYKKLNYNVGTDIAPVSAFVTLPYGFAVSSKVPAAVKDLKAFVAWAKANPNDAAYGHPSTGSSPHFAGNEFNRVAAAGMRHVPYRGSVPAVQDLMGSHIASVMLPFGDVLQFAKAGNARLLGVTSEKRSKLAPEVPTFAEQGFPQITFIETYGVYLPGKATPALRQRFADAIKKAGADAAVNKAMEVLGMEVTPMTPAEFDAYLARQRTRWAPIVAASGFVAEE